jgi:hypothetical protein
MDASERRRARQRVACPFPQEELTVRPKITTFFFDLVFTGPLPVTTRATRAGRVCEEQDARREKMLSVVSDQLSVFGPGCCAAVNG